MLPNLTEEQPQLTVEDHLNAVGEMPEWVISLGKYLEHYLKCDPAIAASRARDLSSNPVTAHGIEQLVTGWNALKPGLSKGLNSWQRDTVLMLVNGISEDIKSELSAVKS